MRAAAHRLVRPERRAERGDAIGPLIFAQLLGGAGYLVLILATQIRHRRNFLIVDFFGLAPVVAHYVLLGAPAGAAMSALYMVIDVTAAFEDRAKLIHRLFIVHYVLAVALVALTFQGPADLLALFGTLTAIVSRQQPRMRHVLRFIVISCVGWGVYGVFAGSVGQVVFSTVYALFGLLGIWRIVRQTHA